MTPRESHPHEDRPSSAEDAYARLLAMRESGTAPDFETWVRQYPEFEAELRELDGSWDNVESSLERLLGFSSSFAPVPLAPPLAPGLRVGEFVLERLIGAGGMGVVWLARQPKLNRSVALKFMRADRESALSPELFAREARAAGRVNDPRIVTVHAAGESDGRRWLAMEYVPGNRSLATWLGALRDAGLPAGHARRAAAFVADVAEALHAGHELGVVHRDVKPQNVLVAPDGTPKLTDFGLARLVDEAALSETLTIRGTVEYMSPEQVTGDTHRLDRRSDVFSLGVLLYELLTLERPFTGVTPIEVITRIAAREPVPASRLVPGLDPDLDVILAKALEKRAEDRYPTALDFARDLRRWLAHEPIGARRPTPLRLLAKWVRRRPTAAAIVVAALLLSVSAIVSLSIYRKGAADAVQSRAVLLVQQAQFQIQDGRMDSAAGLLAECAALLPQDPRPHLEAAVGYSRFLRVQEAEREFEAALRLGFDPKLGADPSADALYLHALWLMAQRDVSNHGQVAEELARAVALDPELDEAWFPLYQMRKSTGDIAGAREALLRFHASVPATNDYWAMSSALIAELDGDHVGAISILEKKRAEVAAERAGELRLARHMGRNYMLQYKQHPEGDPALLDAAEANLRQAVQERADDGNALGWLGLVRKMRADLISEPEERERYWSEAEELGRQAQEHGYGEQIGAAVYAAAAFDRVATKFHVQRVEESELDEVDRRIEVLRDVDPASGLIRVLESGVAYYRGAFALDRGEVESAIELLEESVARSDRQFYARIVLGQQLIEERQDYAAGQELFSEALALWDRHEPGVPGEDPSLERKWLFAAAVWLFSAADRNAEPEIAAEALDRALMEMDENDEGFEPAEFLTLAEFLASPIHDEFRDCDMAKDLLERHGLEALFGEDLEGAKVLAKIRAECGS